MEYAPSNNSKSRLKKAGSSKNMTTKIAIFGVGLIGGSLALCFKGKEGLTVVGHAHRPESASKYISRGVVDSATLSVEEAAIDADFIFYVCRWVC